MAVATERSSHHHHPLAFQFGAENAPSENSITMSYEEDGAHPFRRRGNYHETHSHPGVGKDPMEVSIVAQLHPVMMHSAHSDTLLLSKEGFPPPREPNSAYKKSIVQLQRNAGFGILRFTSPEPAGLVYATKESPGYRSKMEDRTAFIPDFAQINIFTFEGESLFPLSLWGLRSQLIPPFREDLMAEEKTSPYRAIAQRSFVYSSLLFDYAGVFDGHGGHSVSEALSKSLHAFIQASLVRHMNVHDRNSHLRQAPFPANHWNAAAKDLDSGVEAVRAYLNSQDVGQGRDGFEKSRVACKSVDYFGGHQLHMSKGIRQLEPPPPIREPEVGLGDEMAVDIPDGVETTKNLAPLSLLQIEQAVCAAFENMNENLPDAKNKTIGSTAVVAMISQLHVIVANVGDSRCVLSRGGHAFRLSRDHKPDQEDEEERIHKHGGRVWDFNGRRVMGLLAMTRAFGDDCLKEFGITAKPEVTILPRSQDDEFLILACDGLWDVVTDDEACSLVQRCFARAEARLAGPESACRVAASVLSRAAFDKGSNDNVSVMVVDLRAKRPTAPKTE